MKKNILIFSLLGIFLFYPPAPADDTPKTAMNFIAVLDLNCGASIDKEVCAALTNIVIEELVKINKYTVIDRANRDKILAEQGFQQTGCVEGQCTVEMGRLLGVGKIVTGSISRIGQTYLISLQLINVQTGAVEAPASEQCKCDLDGLIEAARIASRKLMGEAATAEPPPAAAPEPITDMDGNLIPEPPPGKAMVIFYRPPSVLITPSAYRVYEGDKVVWKSAPRLYFVHITDPGSHTYVIKWQKKGVVTVDLKEGEIAFVQLYVSQTGMAPVVTLINVPEGVGRADIVKCRADTVDPNAPHE